MKRAASSYLIIKHDKRKWHNIVSCNYMSSRTPTSNKIRQQFLDYFIKEHKHTFIRSSPVFSLCDPTVPFVNAGMNQFKGIFLGNDTPPCLRAANSQKCIRVTGKHNDLNSVGKDGYHHTFFEMLGNWSFGDYFKYDACEMAWNLLIGSFKINPQRLYVTYFGGDKNLNLEPDFETKEIWKKIGVPEERILPFGMKDNFWEMGPTGPCGPCSEIHIDHVLNSRFVPDRVNKGFPDVTELWNLVFIQFKRNFENKLEPLPKHHVDTGMGFERLVAILQGKQSNYDTDLFTYLFKGIEKESNAPSYSGHFDNSETHIDYSYRRFADHARMITAALADGMRPDQNPKLRRILRKAFLISEQSFNIKHGLLKVLVNYVAETLSDAYPEISKNLNKVQLIIEHEEKLFQSLRQTAHAEWKKIVEQKPELKLLNTVETPSLIAGFQYLKSFVDDIKEKQNINTSKRLFLPIDTAVKMFQSFGLDIDTIEQLASAEGLDVDTASFEKAISEIKLESRMQSSQNVKDLSIILNQLIESGVSYTDDSYKYNYTKNNSGKYFFPELKSYVQAIIVNGQLVSKIDECPSSTCEVLLDKTSFYTESGGQSADIGILILSDGLEINITDVRNVSGMVLHKITLEKNFEIKIGDEVTLKIDSSHRLCNMQNHTATHLLNAALHKIFPVTYQKSSTVNPSYFTFDFSFYGNVLKPRDVLKVEDSVTKAVSCCSPVNRCTVTANELLAMDDVTLIPGITYPESDIHIIEIETHDLKSKEACCGTHVLNTGDIEKFHIVNIRNSGTGTKSLRAVTANFAVLLEKKGSEVRLEIEKMSAAINLFLKSENSTAEEAEELNNRLVSLRRHILTCNDSIPYSVYIHCLEEIQKLGEYLKGEARTLLRDSLRLEMKRVLNRVSDLNEFYLVHFLNCSSSIDNVPLLHATRMCPPYLPVIVLCRSQGLVKARCCVPESLVSEHFSAELWMQSVLSSLNAEGGPPRGQDPRLVFNMKKKRVPDDVFETLLVSAIENAKKFADSALNFTQSVKLRQDSQK